LVGKKKKKKCLGPIVKGSDFNGRERSGTIATEKETPKRKSLGESIKKRDPFSKKITTSWGGGVKKREARPRRKSENRPTARRERMGPWATRKGRGEKKGGGGVTSPIRKEGESTSAKKGEKDPLARFNRRRERDLKKSIENGRVLVNSRMAPFFRKGIQPTKKGKRKGNCKVEKRAPGMMTEKLSVPGKERGGKKRKDEWASKRKKKLNGEKRGSAISTFTQRKKKKRGALS